MSDGTYADIEELEGIAEAVRTTSELMADAADYAKEADPDPYMWGMVGMPSAYLYFEITPNIHKILQRIPEAIEGLAGRIEDSTGATSSCDDEIKGEFEKLLEELTGKG